MMCEKCNRDLVDDEPVYRFQDANGATIRRCRDCATRMGTIFQWRPPVPCEGCGRPVSYREDRHRRLHVSCGERSCLRSIRAAGARSQRRQPRVCICGIEFKPTRGDARYCSPACKQRAYRQRVTAPTPPPRRPEPRKAGPVKHPD